MCCSDQRMHSVQVEVQYVYIAEAICEYGRAMGYLNQPELLNQFVKFKAAFDDYVSKLPNPGQAPPPPPAGAPPAVPPPGVLAAAPAAVPAVPPAGVLAAAPAGVPAVPPVGVPAAPCVPSPCASPMEIASPRPSPIAQQVGAAPAPARPVQVVNVNAHPVPQVPARPPVPAPGGAAPFHGTVGAQGGPPAPVKNANPAWPPRQGAANQGAVVSAPAFSPQDRGRLIASTYIY
ncbi:hypothetical protein TELCIR_13113 [Teladorsagia circumcincta]|uniref:Uncharacterized protein n=1 Tax=Teladorsagia circumcincta TaxID=45464 RepID=A0A2G9U4L3_TELCI|nr:hypothetical protein TELCIR_13113 [Teladorsagia circumcincta]